MSATPFNVFSQVQMEDTNNLPHLNTGTPYDISMGAYRPGVGGSMILDGGFALTNGIAARENRGKSTQMNGMIMRVLGRYRHTQGNIHDTEGSQRKTRLAKLHGMCLNDPVAAAALSADIEQRFFLTGNEHGDLDWYNDKLKEIGAARLKHRKELEVETPFLDPKTLKPMRMLVPFISGLDSLTKGTVDSAYAVLDEFASGDKKTQTVFMKEGLAKTKIVNQWPRMCALNQIYLGATVHVGDKMMDDPYAPKIRDLPMMRHGEKIMGAGGAFLYLVSNLVELRDTEIVMDSKKEAKYPFKHGSVGAAEFVRTFGVITRCKNAPAGTKCDVISSQVEGILPELTGYDYLVDHDNYGLIGNDRSHKTVFTEASLNRHNIQDKLTDPKIARAIELLYQICYIYNNWTWRDFPVPFDIDITTLPDLLQKKSYAIDDILTSRGYWTYRDEFTKAGDLPPYMSAYDVLAIIAGRYTPVLYPARTVPSADVISPKKK